MDISFETEETVVLREGSRVSISYCSGCSREVLMAIPQAAALLSRVGEREIFRLIENGLVHFSEDGRVLVCLASVANLGHEI